MPSDSKFSVPRGRRLGETKSFEDRRQEIIDASAALFSRKGYAATSISEIVEACGLNGRGSLYHYIGSKNQILVSIAFSVLEPLSESTNKIAALTGESVQLRLRLISELFLTAIAHRPEHVRVYENDFQFLTGSHRTTFIRLRHELEETVIKLLEEGVAGGELIDTDSRMTMFAFFNLHNRTVQWFNTSGSWTPGLLSVQFCRIFFGGLAIPNGTNAEGLEEDVADFCRRNPAWSQLVIP